MSYEVWSVCKFHSTYCLMQIILSGILLIFTPFTGMILFTPTWMKYYFCYQIRTHMIHAMTMCIEILHQQCCCNRLYQNIFTGEKRLGSRHANSTPTGLTHEHEFYRSSISIHNHTSSNQLPAAFKFFISAANSLNWVNLEDSYHDRGRSSDQLPLARQLGKINVTRKVI